MKLELIMPLSSTTQMQILPKCFHTGEARSGLHGRAYVINTLYKQPIQYNDV